MTEYEFENHSASIETARIHSQITKRSGYAICGTWDAPAALERGILQEGEIATTEYIGASERAAFIAEYNLRARS